MMGDFSLNIRSPGLKGWFRSAYLATVLVLFCIAASHARAALQFDVFLGYEGIIPEASWFPVVCEIKNDGPSFTGTVELDSGVYNQGQTRRLRPRPRPCCSWPAPRSADEWPALEPRPDRRDGFRPYP